MPTFNPDYATPPGETIAEWLDEHRMTQAELAKRIDVSEKMLSQLIAGHVPLSRTTASKLEVVTRIPARTWNSLEAHYQDGRSRLEAAADLESQADWLAEIPVKQLRKIGAISATAKDVAGQVRQALEFFGVSDANAWRRVWLGDAGPAAAFRKSAAFAEAPGAVASWLRRGELEAETRQVAAYNPSGLRAALPTLRALTLEPKPEVFIARLTQITAEHGVILLFVPEVVGSRCSGASYWYRDRPVVQLSLRYKSDDHLWFTFFHELAHILLHGKRDAFVSDGKAPDSSIAEKEHEANTFAGRLLIPVDVEAQLANLRTVPDIAAFAARLGISPGIVVGRLQRERIIGYNFANNLKRRYRFIED